MALPQSAPEEQDVYSLTPLSAVRSSGEQRGVGVQFTFRSRRIWYRMKTGSYKHLAPPEQEPSNQ